jgi:hypothetical protein
MPNRRPEPQRRKTPEELLREVRNSAIVAVVTSGFDAIDELTERGKEALKKRIIRAIAGKK